MDGGAVWPSHYTAAQRHSQYMSLRKQIQSNSSHIDFYRILSCTILILEDITDIAHGFYCIFSEWYGIDTPAFCKVSAFFEKFPWKNRVVNGWLAVTGDLSKSLGEIRGPHPFLCTSQREVLTHRGSRGISMWFPSQFPLLRASMYVMVCNVLQVCKKSEIQGIEYIDF